MIIYVHNYIGIIIYIYHCLCDTFTRLDRLVEDDVAQGRVQGHPRAPRLEGQ